MPMGLWPQSGRPTALLHLVDALQQIGFPKCRIVKNERSIAEQAVVAEGPRRFVDLLGVVF